MNPIKLLDLRALVGLSAAALLVGCAGNSEPVDTDGDDLVDQFEAAIGTDPEDADTDGDGFTDGEEYLNYFDPLEEDDFPREGDYPRQARPRDLDGEGTEVGDVLDDFIRVDQYNEEISLHEFYGNVVVIGIGAEW
jgi:hypothetical protein